MTRQLPATQNQSFVSGLQTCSSQQRQQRLGDRPRAAASDHAVGNAPLQQPQIPGSQILSSCSCGGVVLGGLCSGDASRGRLPKRLYIAMQWVD